MTQEQRPDTSRSSLGQVIATVYRVAWLSGCSVLAAVGVTVLAILSLAVLVTLFVAFALVGAALALAGVADKGEPSGRGRARRTLAGALVAGAAAPAYVGLAAVLGPRVLLLILVVGATSPSAMNLYGRGLRAAAAPTNVSIAAWAPGFPYPLPTWAPPQLPPDLDVLSTEELCEAWCASYFVLKDRSSRGDTKAALATVTERQSYLDELARRNASGLTAWLASGARVASNPLPYLTGNRIERTVIDWDELT
jgi:hypothetical protein